MVKFKLKYSLYLIVFQLLLLGCFSSFYKTYKIKHTSQSFSLTLNSLPKSLGPIHSTSVYMINQKTGEVLFDYNSDFLIPPASMTKLVSLFIAYHYIHEGIVSKDSLVPVPRDAWAKNLPHDSSLMFLEPGQKVTLHEIMLGLAIPSGNDAAIALADFIAGSVPQFVKIMNKTVLDLGLKHLHFEDANGYSYNNYITAKDFTTFSRIYLEKYPESIEELHAVTQLIYPTRKNYTKRIWRRRKSFVSQNHNTLLGNVEGVDGLKTGYVGKSGFNVAITAKRGDMRLTGAVLGSFNKNVHRARKNRDSDAEKVLNYLFENYRIEHDSLQKPYEEKIGNDFITSQVMPSKQYLTVRKGPLTYKACFSYLNPFFYQKNDVIGSLLIEDVRGDMAYLPLVVDHTKAPKNLLDVLMGFLYKIFTAFSFYSK